MNKFKVYSVAFLAGIALTQAQDVETAKKAIDAEKLENAKTILKSVLSAKPSNGKASFLLGAVYLKQNSIDSAKVVFDKGITASEMARFNNIGLGQIDLEAGNKTAAQLKFDAVIKELKKKDFEEYIYIARSFMNISNPDFKSAIEVIKKAVAINPTDPQVQLALGDAYFGDKNQNEAYVAYRAAYTADPTLIRAKMQLGVLVKGANLFDEAIKAFDEVIAINPNYGPVYRELAETYNKWSYIKPGRRAELTPKSLAAYEKYMSLTDYSLSSRMRHADFLILAKDYKALEAEATAMQKLDKVNPRILRYLGYSAYENGNSDVAISALTDFISNGTNKLIARDYLILGQAKLKKSVMPDGLSTDPALFAAAITDIKKTLEVEPTMAMELNDLGKKYFSQKLYGVASSIFELAITNPTSPNIDEDNVYYGLSVYSANRKLEPAKMDKIQIINADKALDTFILSKPTYQDAYLYKARLNNLLDNDAVMTATYEKYLELVIAKGPEEVTKNKVKVIESYNNSAAFYANTDKVKAKALLAKTLEIDPTNDYALKTTAVLK